MADPARLRRNPLRAAFLNAYNLTGLAGIGIASAVTGDWWLSGIGLAAESLWLLFAPNSQRFQRALNARQAVENRTEKIRQMQEQVALLPGEERQRAHNLGTRVTEVKAECARNPQLQGEFMAAQLDRLDDLLADYIQLALTAYRCDTYLNRADTRQISHERDTWQKAAEDATDLTARELALQNVAILEKRSRLIEEMNRFVARARAQMALIQNTIALLRDQVMTLGTPEALSLRLDELVVSVEAVRDAAREVEAAVGGPPHLEPGLAVPPNGELSSGDRNSSPRVRT